MSAKIEDLTERRRQRRAAAAKGAKCPICGAARVEAHRPFCSKSCADRDLAKWLGGDYRVPGRAAAIVDDERAEDDDKAERGTD